MNKKCNLDEIRSDMYQTKLRYKLSHEMDILILKNFLD